MTLNQYKQLTLEEKELELERMSYMIELCYRALDEVREPTMQEQIDRMMRDLIIGHFYLYE